MIDRRDILKIAAAVPAAAAISRGSLAFAQDAAKKPRSRIVFLGTKGGPRVGIGASNPANAVDRQRHALCDRLRHGRQPATCERRHSDSIGEVCFHQPSPFRSQSRIRQSPLQRLGRRTVDPGSYVRSHRPGANDQHLLGAQPIRYRHAYRRRRQARYSQAGDRQGHHRRRRGAENRRRHGDRVPHPASADHRQFRLQVRDAGRHRRVLKRHQLQSRSSRNSPRAPTCSFTRRCTNPPSIGWC